MPTLILGGCFWEPKGVLCFFPPKDIFVLSSISSLAIEIQKIMGKSEISYGKVKNIFIKMEKWLQRKQ